MDTLKLKQKQITLYRTERKERKERREEADSHSKERCNCRRDFEKIGRR